MSLTVIAHLHEYLLEKNNSLYVIKTNDSLLIPLLTSPTSFQNYGLHRLPLGAECLYGI